LATTPAGFFVGLVTEHAAKAFLRPNLKGGPAMIAPINEYQTVEALMKLHCMNVYQLVRFTGVDVSVAEAIANQRYTPSPLQRERVSQALRFPRSRIIWGHATAVEEDVYARL
jgi:hypothetical protein